MSKPSNCRRDGQPYTFPLIIGADTGSSTKPDCFAWFWPNLPPAFQIGEGPYVQTAPMPISFERLNKYLGQNERVLLFVEKSTAAIPRFYVHRNAAEGVIKRARALWGRRLIVVRIDPKSWQGELDMQKRTLIALREAVKAGAVDDHVAAHTKVAIAQGGSKWLSRLFCKYVLDYDPPDDDHADARCILEVAMNHAKAYSKGAPNRIDGSIGG